MNALPDDRLESRLEICAGIAAILVIVLGGFGLAGWALNGQALQTVLKGLPAMVPNTAIGLILAGSALWLRRRQSSSAVPRLIALALAAAVTGLGLVTFCEHVTGWNAGIDTWFFSDKLRRLTTPIPGRPAILTALNFALLGLALLALDIKTRSSIKLSELPAVTAIVISLLALIGYVCNFPVFYGWRSLFPGTGMALHTLSCFTALGIGVLCARPRGGLMQIVVSPTPSGSMARRLLLAPVLIPLVTGVLQRVGQHYGIYNQEVASWFFAFVNIFIFTVVLWWNARLLYRAESVQRRTEDDLHRLAAGLEQRIADRTTELSQAIAALQLNEARVRSVLDTALDAVITADAQGRITTWNKEAEKIFGWTAAEISGRALSDTIIPPRYREAHNRGMKHFLASGEGPVLNKRIEITALKRDGSEFPVELAITPIRVGDSFTFSAFVRDITERKRAEEELRRSEQSFRELADVMPQIVWTAKADGSPDYFNRRWYEFTGASNNQPGEHSWALVIHPDDWEPSRNRWANAVSSGHSFQVEYRFKDLLTGAYRWHLGRALPVRDSHGRIIRWLGTCTDIQDQKQAQEGSRRINDTLEQHVRDRTIQLEEANKELESFSYSVSHDLRAPLRHIAGFAQMLEDHCRGALDETGHRYLRTISDSSRQMGRLIDDLLVFARMGRAELHRSPVCMDELVTEVINGLASDLAGRNVEWHREPLPTVTGDPGLLKQVWTNLLSNAVKYSRPRNPAIIHIASTKAKDMFTFVVKDNGVGFDMEYVDKVFGVFQRLHHASEFEGTGIGLSIVQRIVQKHGGAVRAEGILDRGATFTFTLPDKTDAEEQRGK